jgi:hypothetical protein
MTPEEIAAMGPFDTDEVSPDELANILLGGEGE